MGVYLKQENLHNRCIEPLILCEQHGNLALNFVPNIQPRRKMKCKSIHSRIYNWLCFRIGLRRDNCPARHSWGL